MNNKLYHLALTKIPKVGSVLAKSLLSYCGSPEAVFTASAKKLHQIPGIGPKIISHIRSEVALREAEKELFELERHDIRALFFWEEAYPDRLRQQHDSPLVLFLKGDVDLNAERTVAVIGTRKPSPQGLQICEELIGGLAQYQPVIISGLAYGIDICAHQKAMELGLPTVASLAHGLGHLYPAAHRNYARRIQEEGGLLSEYGFSVKPEKEFFPMRNRIVAGLCDALIVVETGRRGGSMITAEFANNYNRDVFAVPGRLRDKLSAGCNQLIKSHRAALIESAEDIAYVLRWDKAAQSGGVQQQLFPELDENEKIIIDLLYPDKETHIDNLTFKAQKTGSEIAAILLGLEFKGLIRSLPGKRYLRSY